MKKGLDKIFDEYLEHHSLFTQKKVFQSNWMPDTLIHRDEQIEQMATILAPCLRGQKPSNIFLYGKTGTGKTVSASYVMKKIGALAQERDIPLKIITVNCKLRKVADTEYRLIAHLARHFDCEIPATGLPTEEVYSIFYDAVEKVQGNIILVLDEIDQLLDKSGNDVLYNLTRINSELQHSQISFVGISNTVTFTSSLDPRIKSSLSEEELVFPPYNAFQIQKILSQRSELAFRPNSIGDGVIQKCAAYAARDHGDARLALNLLRVSAEIAERNREKQVMLAHVDHAEEKIEHDRVLDIVQTQPKQFQLTLYTLLTLHQQKGDTNAIFTGEIYDLYRRFCQLCDLRPLTQRRVSDIIAEMDMLGIITAKVVSKGRYGRTREIALTEQVLSPELHTTLKNILHI